VNKLKLDDVFKFYREYFVPAYSDLVALLNAKPEQIVTEIENTLSHVAQCFNPELPDSKKEENVIKAYNHLVRASLDCYKLLCVALMKKIEKIYGDSPNVKPYYKEFLKFCNEFRKAREIEQKNVGNDPLTSLENYKNVAELGMNLLEKLIEMVEVKPSVFVSYRFTPEDENIAGIVKRLLELEGFVCVDGKTAKAEGVSDKVKKEIEKSDGIVVIFTRDKQLEDGTWKTSNWLINEMSLAVGMGKPVIVFFEDCINPEERRSILGIIGDLEYLMFNRDQLSELLLNAIPYIKDFYKKVLEHRGIFTFF